MTESDLAKPVMQWLAGRGFTPYGEVPFYNRAIDVVGLTETEVEAVELKLCFSRHVIYQAMLNQLTAHRSWCAVATRPRKFAKRLIDGIGLLCVKPEGVEVLAEAATRVTITNRNHIRKLRGAIAYMTPHGEAGLPTMRGIGPAQFVFNAVEKYMSDNPDANWEEIFHAVPNHYAHARSMQGAMGVVRERRSLRLRKINSMVS